MSYKDGSTLKRHIDRKHEDVAKSHKKKAEAATIARSSTSSDSQHSQPRLPSFLASKAKLDRNSPRAKRITHTIMKMIAIDLQPLSFTEDVGFRANQRETEPRYVIPSRASFRKKLLPELYSDIAVKLKDLLAEYSRDGNTIYSITTDAWTSRTTTSYVTYTIHLIDPGFTMVSYVIGTYQFDASHTAVNLRKHIQYTLKEWEIISSEPTSDEMEETAPAEVACDTDVDDEDQALEEQQQEYFPFEEEDGGEITLPYNIQIFITTDNASNISKAVNESGLPHVRCFAHTLNLAVQKGLEVASSHITRIRKVVGFFHRSTKGMPTLTVSTMPKLLV
jgi:hypothetical protein